MTTVALSNAVAKREVNGILLLDKPLGLTSNAALQKIKRLYGARKAGHTGSLDPLATGMLPLCFGEATKFSQYLLDSDKTYLITAQLGITTTTGDAEGEIVERKTFDALSRHQLEAALQNFQGQTSQIPPMYSALKHKGQPLYKLARQGIEIERKPRQIMIYTSELLSHNEQQFVFTVRCSKGTYIRSLVEDIGKFLGCGAHVAELRRLAVGPYKESAMLTVEQLENLLSPDYKAIDHLLLPVNTAVVDWPKLCLSEANAFYLQNGQTLNITEAPKPGWVSLYDSNNNFLGIGEVLEDGRLAPRRLVATRRKS